ncbi:MAG: ATP-binding protein [Candidatus Sumerlaeia bacterium]|nr:ATP-binding protein [Candidatus Sumerlaeia bacterium]
MSSKNRQLAREVRSKSDLFDLMDESRELLESVEVSPKAIYTVELALEELVTNVLRYGFPENPSGAVVGVEVELQEDLVVLTFIDEGCPFDPVAAEPPQIPLTLEEAPIGGLGIKMLKKSAHSFEYFREDNRNIVVVQILR